MFYMLSHRHYQTDVLLYAAVQVLHLVVSAIRLQAKQSQIDVGVTQM